MPLKLVFPNRADSLASLAASSEAPGLPVTNLLLQPRGRIWRTLNAADASITGSWDGITTVNAFVLYRHNLSNAATIRFRLYSLANQAGTTLYDSGALAQGVGLGWGVFPFGMQKWGGSSIFDSWSYRYAVLWPTDVNGDAITTALSFRLDISDAANPDGHFEASRLVLGESFEISEDASRGSGWWWDEDTTQKRSAGGSLHSDELGLPHRRWEIKLGYLIEADRANVFDLARAAGKRKDMFISVHPGEGGVKERDAGGLVKIIDLPKITSKPEGWQQHESAVVFEES
jgi:hypothetical protein